MGCTNTKTVKSITDVNTGNGSKEIDKVKEFYAANENLLPNRIRALFQGYFNKETTSPINIDLKFINLSSYRFKPLEVVLPRFVEIRSLNL